MVPPSDDLDLTQAQAYALQPADLAELLGTVQSSLTATLLLLRTAADVPGLLSCLHDLKGYLGLVAAPVLTDLVQQAHGLARQGQRASTRELLEVLIPRLERLQIALDAYRAGIIGS
jgi:HPt (histidine-containing phosphotransfer) domain-containing protein